MLGREQPIVGRSPEEVRQVGPAQHVEAATRLAPKLRLDALAVDGGSLLGEPAGLQGERAEVDALQVLAHRAVALPPELSCELVDALDHRPVQRIELPVEHCEASPLDLYP